ncbi:Uncharacterised protein [BD1-7 clade bacterium]|uniref:Uncharacterized protein n=1 Tax=BD1-7 clade bacterium TaxID=2029982 RepID=A0A5S9QD10_9GAMM|nr:Uncharacterised protein [BD1-7 clade bacterium]CAA0119005.1 Uncharacterised protein [BD1-7 clade bacterium]
MGFLLSGLERRRNNKPQFNEIESYEYQLKMNATAWLDNKGLAYSNIRGSDILP